MRSAVGEDESLRVAARRHAAGDPAGSRVLVEIALPIVERVIRGTLRDGRRERRFNVVTADAVIVDFLHDRLPRPEVLDGIATAERSVGFLCQCVANFANDQLRRLPPVFVHGIDDASVGELAARGDDLDDGPDLELESAVVDELDEEQRILLRVSFAEDALRDTDVAWLAEQRGVPPAQVERELSDRAARFRGEREELRRLARHHAARLERTRERLVRVDREISTRGESEVAAAETRPAHAVMDRTVGLASATAGERVAYRDYLLERAAKHEAALANLAERLGSEVPASMDWPDVARIMGALPSEASPEDARRVANTVEVRVKRLRKRLRVELWGREV